MHGYNRFYQRATFAVALLSIGLVAGIGAVEAEAAADEPAAEPAAADEQSQQKAESSSKNERVALRASNASPRTTYFDSGRKARFDFELAGPSGEKRDVVVKAVKVSSGKVKRRWRFRSLAGKDAQKVEWNGKLGGRDGGWTGQGKHVFKVYGPGKQKADLSKSEGKPRFRFYKHRFPLRARHTYGDGLGAGRGHKGQDIFAKCGKKIRAVKGGKVQYSGYHSSAGNYVVIDGRGTGRDYVYMHLQKRSLPKTGDRIRTGELVGFNGETGNASGCHLHFEMWSGPGWYEGGNPMSPTKPMKRWDSWS